MHASERPDWHQRARPRRMPRSLRAGRMNTAAKIREATMTTRDENAKSAARASHQTQTASAVKSTHIAEARPSQPRRSLKIQAATCGRRSSDVNVKSMMKRKSQATRAREKGFQRRVPKIGRAHV